MAWKSTGARLGVLVAALVMVGCHGGSSVKEPPGGSVVSQPSDTTANYVIGPGDSLHVFVWRNDDLGATVAVRPDGKISIPLVSDMPAVGKTPSQLAKDIEAALGQYIRSPSVAVIVESFGIGAYDNQVRVVGAGAVKPQAIPYRQGLTVLDVMIEVGLSEFAAGDRAKLVRRQNGEVKETPLHLNRLVNRGDLSQNLTLQPGDVVIIPQARF
jgi:polysaccharide export outer membrane protein